MLTYTILLDYRGGTYISQVSAESPALALQEWAARLPHQPIPGISSVEQQQFRQQLADSDAPVSVDGLVNVYCQTASIQDHLALFNLVATVAP